MSVVAGKAPWIEPWLSKKAVAGNTRRYNQLNKSFSKGPINGYTEDDYHQKVSHIERGMKTSFPTRTLRESYTARDYKMPMADYEELVQYINEHNSELSDIYKSSGKKSSIQTPADYIDYSFNNKSQKAKLKTAECEGGHIKSLTYNSSQMLLQVEFRDSGDVVVFFNLPANVAALLIHYAENNVMAVSRVDGTVRHQVGVEFWNLVRIRGTIRGTRYPFQYVVDNRTGGDFGRKRGTGTDGKPSKFINLYGQPKAIGPNKITEEVQYAKYLQGLPEEGIVKESNRLQKELEKNREKVNAERSNKIDSDESDVNIEDYIDTLLDMDTSKHYRSTPKRISRQMLEADALNMRRTAYALNDKALYRLANKALDSFRTSNVTKESIQDYLNLKHTITEKAIQQVKNNVKDIQNMIPTNKEYKIDIKLTPEDEAIKSSLLAKEQQAAREQQAADKYYENKYEALKIENAYILNGQEPPLTKEQSVALGAIMAQRDAIMTIPNKRERNAKMAELSAIVQHTMDIYKQQKQQNIPLPDESIKYLNSLGYKNAKSYANYLKNMYRSGQLTSKHTPKNIEAHNNKLAEIRAEQEYRKLSKQIWELDHPKKQSKRGRPRKNTVESVEAKLATTVRDGKTYTIKRETRGRKAGGHNKPKSKPKVNTSKPQIKLNKKPKE